MQKDHSVAENIQINILLGLFLTSICPTNDIKEINNNTNIHLDLRQIGCYCMRPFWPHTITANIVVGLDEYLLNIKSKYKAKLRSKFVSLLCAF